MSQPGSKDPSQVTIAGVVIPAERGMEGEIIRVALAAADDSEILVEPTAKGRELLKHLHTAVEVTGRLKQVKGRKVVVVTGFSPKKDWGRPLGQAPRGLAGEL